MPKYTKKEFAIACDIKTKNLAVYIMRGKVVVTDGKIDTDLEINKYFLDEKKQFSVDKAIENKVEEKTEPAADQEKDLNDRSAGKKTKEVNPEFKFPKEHTPNPAQVRNFELDTEIKQQNIQKERINIQLQQARLDKINGVTVPTELVKNLFMHHSKSITVAFHNAAETLLSKIAKQKGIDIAEMSALRTELIEIVNEAVNESIEVSKKTLASIVAEHSQKKEVGEHQ